MEKTLMKWAAVRREWGVAAVLLAAAAVIRCVGIGRLEIWHDEACSVLTAQSPGGVWAALRVDTNAPLYFFLLKWWIALFGIGATALRAMSAAFSVATVGALGGWMRESGASWRTTWWAMALCAVAPMQVYYGQEARPYALVVMLSVLALWTYTRAMKGGSVWAWAGHGVCVLLGLYTHNVFALWAVALPGATWMLGGKRRDWIAQGIVYAVVGVMYVPGLMLVLNQTGNGGTEWIREVWAQTPPGWAMVRSVEVLTVGGHIPALLALVSVGAVWRVAADGLLVLALGMAFWRGKGGGGWRELGRFRWVLVLFAVWPLVDLWLYSVARTPIYVVGRYDVLAGPALLGIAALGVSRVMDFRWGAVRWRAVRMAGAVCGCGVLMGVMLFGWYTRWTMAMGPEYFPHRMAGEARGRAARKGDVIVCMDLEGAATLYQCRLRGIEAEVKTLPLETGSHIGWVESAGRMMERRAEVVKQMRGLLDEMGRGEGRVWVVIPPVGKFPWEGDAGTVVDAMTRRFFEEGRGRGWRELRLTVADGRAARVAGMERDVAVTGAVAGR